MDKPLPAKCAIIGLGRIAGSLEDDALREKPATHAGAITANPDTVLAAGSDVDPDARKAFGKRWKLDSVYSDAAQMIREIKPDILHITTHEDSHLEYLALAIREHVPVVVLEKPVSDNLRKARKMLQLLKAPGSPVVLVNHERRYSSDYRQVKNRIAEKTYGNLLSVTGRLYMGLKRPLESMLLHDGTHLLDIIPYLSGFPLRNLKVPRLRNNSHTLYVSATSGETDVLLEIGNARDHLVFELDMSFSGGRIRVGNGIYEEQESLESTFYENMKSLYSKTGTELGPTRYFSAMLEDALRVYRQPEAQPVSSYRDGVDSLALVQKIRARLKRAG